MTTDNETCGPEPGAGKVGATVAVREPHNLYIWGLSRQCAAPDAARLRFEDPVRPGLGQLITIGSVVRTTYGTGPYRVSWVERIEPFPGIFYWSIVGQDVVDGVALKGSGDKILNEYVVEWEGDRPRFRSLFRNNDDEILLDNAVVFVATRRGQLSLF